MTGSRAQSDGGPAGSLNNSNDGHEPSRHRGWRRGRELAGIAAVIVILVLISVVLIVVFQGQGQPGVPYASSASVASPSATNHYPSLPATAIYNPGAQAVYDAGLGKHVDLTHTSNGYVLTVHWVYADAVQAIVSYSITPPANSKFKFIESSLLVTEATKATNAGNTGGGVGGSAPISSDGRSDFLIASQDFRPLTSNSNTISLVLSFSDIHSGTGVGQPAWVADGMTMKVTVPFDPGQSIAVNKKGSMQQVQISLDRVIVAPSGVMAMLSYPNAKSVNVQQWREVLAKLSDDVNADAQEQGPMNVPGTPSVRFPTPPPASLNGNWSLTLRPYDSSGNLSADPSQWLSFTFPVGSRSATTASSIPAEIQQLPGALQLYKAGLGLSLNKSVKSGDVTVTLHWIYADAHQVWAAYTVTGLQAGFDLRSASGRLAAQHFCGWGSLSASLDNEPARRIDGGGQGGPLGGGAQGCLASEDVYFSGDNLGAVAPVTVTIHGEVPTAVAQSSAFNLSAKVVMVPGRAAAVHHRATLGGKTLELDGVNVTPTGLRLFFAGDATKLEYFTASRFTVNGQPAGITTIGGTSIRWSPNGDQVYDLNYDDPGWEMPWTIKVMLVTKFTHGGPLITTPEVTPATGTGKPAIFTFTLPPASWDTSIVATPVP